MKNKILRVEVCRPPALAIKIILIKVCSPSLAPPIRVGGAATPLYLFRGVGWSLAPHPAANNISQK